MRYLLGVDLGTTSVKSVLFNQEGKVMASSISEYGLLFPQPDFVEVEPETYWNAFKESLAKSLDTSKIDPENIAGIGVSSQGETFIAFGNNGKPLADAIVWLDNRSKKEAELIRNQFDVDLVYRITGQNEVATTWTATKILWLRRNKPALFRKIHKILLLEDYLLYRLTGTYATEHTLACSTLLYDISKIVWWDEMLDFIGLRQDQLPELHAPGTPIGNIAPKVAKETGLNEGTIVSTGAYDQAANALGAGNLEPGVVTETTGGALAVAATVDRIVLDPQRRMPCHHHAVSGRFFLQPWCQTAGSILKWYRDNFGLTEVEKAKSLNVDSYDVLMAQASEVPPGSDGLILLPHFMGAASPEFNPNAKGVLFGLTFRHSRGHFVRAIVESVAYMLRRNIELLESINVNVKEVRSTGGAARSTLWTQVKADVLQKPILTVHTEETAALGVAMLAGVATGTFSSLEKAVKSMVSVKARFTPMEANRVVYDKRYKKYIDLYRSLESLF